MWPLRGLVISITIGVEARVIYIIFLLLGNARTVPGLKDDSTTRIVGVFLSAVLDGTSPPL